jgi:hypothetical protein
MQQSACSSSVSTPPRLRIPTCSYVLQRGSLCLGAAVRGRSFCRHHLRIRIRLRRMARSRRATPVLAPVSLADAAAIRQTEIGLRVSLAARRIDPAAGRAIFWALRMARDLARTLDRYEQRGLRPRRRNYRIHRPKFNRINQVPLNPLDGQSYLENDS